MSDKLLHRELSEKIISTFYEVYNTLGHGFLEKVYENALVIALRKRGVVVHQQWPITVRFDGTIVGEYFADLCIDELVIVEIKICDAICDAHKSQLLNYLTATETELGMILNFGPEPSFTRKVMSKK
ncbi:GxxExxY protein [Aeoliella sp. SH292]|uniref:GxxExxY protein n=1 Tax=Aeoliella sp. SH292 TaxID=3454464 RepID=UPI003F9768D2